MSRGPEATERDAEVFRWVGEMYLARADVVAVLLGRLSPAEPREPGRVGPETVRHHARRWERLGLCSWRRMLGHGWVVPTRRGLLFAGVDVPAYEPVGHRLAHMHATAVVRLAVEAEFPGVAWTSERVLRLQRREDKAGWWLPDGMADLTLVEVELTRKQELAFRDAAAYRQHPKAAARTYFAPAGDVEALRARVAQTRTWAVSSRQPWVDTAVHPLPVVAGVSYNGVR
jgi:hypothetical protein